jgi:hypothetical protein
MPILMVSLCGLGLFSSDVVALGQATFAKNCNMEGSINRIHVMTSSVLLLVGIESLRHDEMQMILGTRHCHVEQTALFLNFLCCTSGEIRRDTAVDAIENKHGLPFLPLGRMNSRENEVIVVQSRCTSLIASGVRWIQRQLSQKLLAIRITQGNLRQLHQICLTHHCIVVNALEMWFIPPTDQFRCFRPADRFAMQQTDCFAKLRPMRTICSMSLCRLRFFLDFCVFVRQHERTDRR